MELKKILFCNWLFIINRESFMWTKYATEIKGNILSKYTREITLINLILLFTNDMVTTHKIDNYM